MTVFLFCSLALNLAPPGTSVTRLAHTASSHGLRRKQVRNAGQATATVTERWRARRRIL